MVCCMSSILNCQQDLVGIDSRIEKINSFLAEGLIEVRCIGICGIGGIGKTTTARAAYDRIHWQFERSCFVANVRESWGMSHGATSLQKHFLSQLMMRQKKDLLDVEIGTNEIRRYTQDKKVLIVLDDVDDLEQLQHLAADKSWFGPGSRVILTSRDSHVLSAYGVDEIYRVDLLNDDEALMLFAWKAFKQKQPKEKNFKLSKHVVDYANGLPLALSVLGSHLYGRSLNEWHNAIERLDKVSYSKILNVLKISFDGLEYLEKQIFLDIACFFKGKDKDRVTYILDECGFNAYIGISVLIDKSLVTISQHNTLEMHDLLARLGQEIVHSESLKEPGKRSRLWEFDDLCHISESKTGKEVEGIFVNAYSVDDLSYLTEAFSKMKNLRLLKIDGARFIETPTYFSERLRYLELFTYLSKSLPTSFEPSMLVELHLPNSRIEKLWYGYQDMPRLKILDLTASTRLNETPDFTGIPNLEKLVLRYCKALTKLQPITSKSQKACSFGFI